MNFYSPTPKRHRNFLSAQVLNTNEPSPSSNFKKKTLKLSSKLKTILQNCSREKKEISQVFQNKQPLRSSTIESDESPKAKLPFVGRTSKHLTSIKTNEAPIRKFIEKTRESLLKQSSFKKPSNRKTSYNFNFMTSINIEKTEEFSFAEYKTAIKTNEKKLRKFKEKLNISPEQNMNELSGKKGILAQNMKNYVEVRTKTSNVDIAGNLGEIKVELKKSLIGKLKRVRVSSGKRKVKNSIYSRNLYCLAPKITKLKILRQTFYSKDL